MLTFFHHWVPTLTWHEETVVQHGHKVRVCVSVVHLLADEIKNLGGTLSVYVYLRKEENMSMRTPSAPWVTHRRSPGLTESKRLARASSSSFRSISK